MNEQSESAGKLGRSTPPVGTAAIDRTTDMNKKPIVTDTENIWEMGSACNSILAHGPLTIGVWSFEESKRNMVEEHETGEQNETCRTCEYMQHETHDFGGASMSMSAWCATVRSEEGQQE